MKRILPGAITTPLCLFFCLICSTICSAQIINGQTYTNGLAIINAPAPESQQHAGSTMPISIEISGNGKLPFSAFTPGSRLASSYELLEIYLVSSQTGLNLTISSGTGLLTGETGTVRHHNVVLSSCLASGQYNLTFYETSYINSIPYFIITPIPISISNTDEPGSSCTEGNNQLQEQPQLDHDFGKSPFDPSSPVAASTGEFLPGTTVSQTQANESDPRPTSTVATDVATFVESPAPTFPDGSPSAPSSPVTLVIVAQMLTTFTNNLDRVVTTSFMTTRTTAVPMSTAIDAGFIPINAGQAHLDHLTCIFIPFLMTIWAIVLLVRID